MFFCTIQKQEPSHRSLLQSTFLTKFRVQEMKKLVCQVHYIWVVTEKTAAEGVQNFEKSLGWSIWKLFGFEVEQICKDEEIVAEKVVPY